MLKSKYCNYFSDSNEDIDIQENIAANSTSQVETNNDNQSSSTTSCSYSVANDPEENQLGAGESTSNEILPVTITPDVFEKRNQGITFFENPSLKMSIKKSQYKRSHKFSLLDTLFKIQIIPKKDTTSPIYFKDLLDILDQGLNYIISKLKAYFPDNPEAITYLTLYQKGMLNGLSTGGYPLSSGSEEVVSKLLKMLSRFLTSNENVTVNNEFMIYVDIYSKNHTTVKKKNIYKGRKQVGQSKNFWGIDLQENEHPPFYSDKCLLTAIVLGHLQNCFLEKNDTRYQYAKHISNNNKNKRHHAFNLIKLQIDQLLTVLQCENVMDYTNLDLVAPIVHSIFNCQIVIFSGFDYKIQFMYPQDFNESLRPIFLFDSNTSLQHVVFIKSIKSFFNASKQKTCLFCKKVFKKVNVDHQCKIRPSCLACKRHQMLPNIMPSKFFENKFCNKDSSIAFKNQYCQICQVPIFSQTCETLHKPLCGKHGNLGYRCFHCNKFVYNTRDYKNADVISKHHKCTGVFCALCKSYHNEKDHLCKLKEINFTQKPQMLGFLTMEFLLEDFSSPVTNEVPNLITIYKETKAMSGIFDSHVLSDFCEEIHTDLQTFTFNYCDHVCDIPVSAHTKRNFSKMFDFKLNEAQSKTTSILQRLVKLLTKWAFVTLITADNNGFIFNAFIKAFLQANINVKILSRGKKYFSCEVPELHLKLLNSTNFLPGDEFQIAQVSNFDFKRIYFPFKMNHPQNYSYEGKVPDIVLFICDEDTTKEVSEKLKYVQDFSDTWKFKEQLTLFSNQKCLLLCSSICLFLAELTQLQLSLQRHVCPDNPNKNILLWPFSGTICTFSAFIFRLFKGLFLRNLDIYIVQNEYNVPTRKVSQTEYEFCKYLEFLYPQLELVHNYSNPEGQKFFKECVPDIYIPDLECAIFVNGCYFHGHFARSIPNNDKLHFVNDENFDLLHNTTPDQKFCLASKPALCNTINKRMNESYESLQAAFYDKVTKLLQNNSLKIKEVKVFWECFFHHSLKKSENYVNFKKTFKKHPLERLVPRSVCKGGFNQSFALSWSKERFPDQTFYSCDINGLYSHVAMNQSFNVGKYQVLIGKATNNITIQNGQFYYTDKRIFGVMQVTILPPKRLYFPFLTFRFKDRSVLTLCKKCAVKQIKKCNHKNPDREFFGCYFVEELEFALLLGYEILAIHECHAYFDQKPIFTNFVSLLNYNKIKYSDYLKTTTNELQKELYCKSLNDKLHLSEPNLLQPLDKPNSYKQFLYKLAANSFFGKFQQRKDKLTTLFVGDDDELAKVVEKNACKIQGINCFEDRICNIVLKPEKKEIKDSLNENCYLGAQIVALARIYFYKQIQKVLEVPNSQLFYCDTDSLFFSLPKNVENPLEMSDATGDFKNVYKNVQNFYCLGPKNYTVSCLIENQIQVSTKVRGLNLNSHNLNQTLDSAVYENFLRSFTKNQSQKIKISQNRTRKCTFRPYSCKTKLETVSFTNKINSQRFVDKKSSILKTFPFGY